LLVGLVYWFVGGLIYSLVCWPLRFLLPRRLGQRVGRSMLSGGFRLFARYIRLIRLVEVDLSALAPLRNSNDPCILAPNHIALWDVVFLVSCLPHALCIMKPAILRNPVLGGGASLAGYIPAGNNSRMIRDAAAAVQQGGQLILFPEGTRTRPECRWINPLKGGVALIAARAKVPVRPVFIRTNSRYLEKGWPPWKRPEFPIRICFELGPPLVLAPGESTQQFVARLQQVFECELSRPHPLRRQSRT